MSAELAIVPGGPLAALQVAHDLLDAASGLDEVRTIRDRAEALRTYCEAAGLGLVMQNQCAALKLRAERKAGELLATMPKKSNQHAAATSVTEAGISHNQSSRWQREASVPEDVFEGHVAETIDAGRELTQAGVLKLAKRTAAADKPGLNLRVVTDTYPAIVIDPPWQYDNKATRGAAEDHYPTMSIAELEALELPAATDAHLYLWVTNGFLRQGFDLIDVWGFAYKTCLTWVKPQIGMGNYFRNNTEHVLFAIRGKLATQRNNVPTWFQADRAKHSAKPECFYDLVEACSPGPRLEMFARRRRIGWDTWGNEA